MKLSASQVYYLRTVARYYDGDRYISWVIGRSRATVESLVKRGLMERNPEPRASRDRQSHRPTAKGREVLAQYAGREVSIKRIYGRPGGYKAEWKDPDDVVTKLASVAL